VISIQLNSNEQSGSSFLILGFVVSTTRLCTVAAIPHLGGEVIIVGALRATLTSRYELTRCEQMLRNLGSFPGRWTAKKFDGTSDVPERPSPEEPISDLNIPWSL
jgi:hypothetical protein